MNHHLSESFRARAGRMSPHELRQLRLASPRDLSVDDLITLAWHALDQKTPNPMEAASLYREAEGRSRSPKIRKEIQALRNFMRDNFNFLPESETHGETNRETNHGGTLDSLIARYSEGVSFPFDGFPDRVPLKDALRWFDFWSNQPNVRFENLGPSWGTNPGSQAVRFSEKGRGISSTARNVLIKHIPVRGGGEADPDETGRIWEFWHDGEEAVYRVAGRQLHQTRQPSRRGR